MGALAATACDGPDQSPSSVDGAATTVGPDGAAGPDLAAEDAPGKEAGKGTALPAEENAALATQRDGTRLKAGWYVAPDGKRSFDSFYDTELGVPCRFVRAMDGEFRCQPLALTATSANAFADAAARSRSSSIRGSCSSASSCAR